MKNISTCTAAAAIMLSIHPGLIPAAHAASHCKGLQEQVCGSTTACRWQKETVSAKWQDAQGNKMTRKAHCKLDIQAAAKLASEIHSGKGR